MQKLIKDSTGKGFFRAYCDKCGEAIHPPSTGTNVLCDCNYANKFVISKSGALYQTVGENDGQSK